MKKRKSKSAEKSFRPVLSQLRLPRLPNLVVVNTEEKKLNEKGIKVPKPDKSAFEEEIKKGPKKKFKLFKSIFVKKPRPKIKLAIVPKPKLLPKLYLHKEKKLIINKSSKQEIIKHPFIKISKLPLPKRVLRLNKKVEKKLPTLPKLKLHKEVIEPKKVEPVVKVKSLPVLPKLKLHKEVIRPMEVEWPILPKLNLPKLEEVPEPVLKPQKDNLILPELPKLKIDPISRPKLTKFSFERSQGKNIPQLETAPLPSLDISTINPWDKVIERMEMCSNSLNKEHLELAETFFYEVKPFFKRLDFYQQNEVYPYLLDLQQKIVMLRMKKIKLSLKK